MQEKTGNASALAVPESHMNDLIHMDEAFDAAAQKEELARTIVDEMPAKDIAFCASKEEWLDMWQVDLNGKDFLVVTGKQIFGSVFFDLVAMKKIFRNP